MQPASDCRWQALITTPHLSVRHFRKSSQWKVLSRSHAELVVADRHVKEMFRRHCYIFNSTQCFVDEHYIPTLISSYGLDNEVGGAWSSWWERLFVLRGCVVGMKQCSFAAFAKSGSGYHIHGSDGISDSHSVCGTASIEKVWVCTLLCA
eukprot:evm.model.scf_38EXC.16 EVM.evm.TU.scf_38EXC.16   scf_38EXC:166453-166902(+)